MKFRLLIISSHYPPCSSPEGIYAMMLCEKLAARGVEVDLLTGELAPDSPAPVGFRIHPLMKAWGWRQFPTLLLAIRRLRPDVVMLSYIDWIYGCHPMITFVPAALRLLKPRTPFITLFTNVSGLTGMQHMSRFQGRWMKRIVRLLAGLSGLHPIYGSLLRDSRSIIAFSERHLEVFELAHPGLSLKAKVIPAPPILRLDSDPISARQRGRRKLGLAENVTILVYFGFIYWMKGMESLLKAFSNLPSTTQLIIIGATGDQGYLDKLQNLSRDLGISKRIIWAGFCVDEVASLYLYAADICALPFVDGVRLNNSSFAVAATHGLPIVSTRGDTLEIPFVDGENVRLCPPNDSTALSLAISELIQFPAIRKRLSDGATKIARDHFSWERVTESTLSVLLASCDKIPKIN